MERDHRRLAAQELEAASQLGVGLVAIPSLAQRQKLDALAAKAGTSGYDAAWLALQRQEHQQLLTLIGTELAKGTEPAVKSVAKGAQPVVQMHLRMVAGRCHAGTGSLDSAHWRRWPDGRRRADPLADSVGAARPRSASPRRQGNPVCGDASSASPRWESGLVMVFGGPPGDAGEVPKAGPSAAEREAAIPPARLALPGFMDAPVMPVATGSDRPAAGAEVAGRRGLVGGGCGAGLGRWHRAARRPRGLRPPRARGVRRAVASAGRRQGRGDSRGWRRALVPNRGSPDLPAGGALPADLFRGASKPRLALVTCIGSYNHSARRYTHNLVLYGVPVARS